MTGLPEAPVLETPRLILRGHRLDDFAASAALWADPDVTRLIGGAPSTPEQSWSRLLRYRGHWALLGFGYWVVTDREGGGFLGEVGLAEYRRALDAIPPGISPDWPEAGWVLAPSGQGRGFAAEAMRAVLGWADATLTAPAAFAIFHPDHARSVALAGRLGFSIAGMARYADKPALLMRRPRGAALAPTAPGL